MAINQPNRIVTWMSISFFCVSIFLQGYFHGYDPKVDPSLPAAFTAAAFRFGHSLLPATVERWSVSHKYIGKSNIIFHLLSFKMKNLHR